MTISLKHGFESEKADGADDGLIQPSNWNDEHQITCATAKLLGRVTAGTGEVEEIGLGAGLAFVGNDLTVDTGSTAISDVTGLQAALDAKVDDSQVSAFGANLIDDADASAARTTLGLGTAATLSTSDIDERARDAVGTALTAGANITITPNDGSDTITVAATGLAATSQTTEMIAGGIASPSDKSYTLVLKMAHGGTITEATTKSVSGTCTATFKVNSTALGGTANSVSSSEQSQAHSSTNTFVAGDDIVLTVSSNSSCVDLAFSLKYTRTLA